MGGLFPDPGQGREAHRLSGEQIRFFLDYGYLKGGRVLDVTQMKALREGLEDIRTGRNPRTADLYEVDSESYSM